MFLLTKLENLALKIYQRWICFEYSSAKGDKLGHFPVKIGISCALRFKSKGKIYPVRSYADVPHSFSAFRVRTPFGYELSNRRTTMVVFYYGLISGLWPTYCGSTSRSFSQLIRSGTRSRIVRTEDCGIGRKDPVKPLNKQWQLPKAFAAQERNAMSLNNLAKHSRSNERQNHSCSANAIDFTNMFRYYSKLGAKDQIFALFEEMQKGSLKPDLCVYPILIKALGKNGVLLHPWLIKVGHVHRKYTRNALINAYGKYGPIEMARQLFDEMSVRSVADWNATILGYWNWGFEDEAKRLFDLMPEKNVITWTTMITGYSKMKDLDSARSYFDRMPGKSVVSWNAMLSGYAQNGYMEKALCLFQEMVSIGIIPDEKTWVVVISACSSHCDPRLAGSVVKMLDDLTIRLNQFIKTALVDLYAKCGRLEMAEKIFNELGAKRTLVTWNTMISAYMRTGDLIAAQDLFDEMPEKDVVSWNSMISGYAQNGQSALAIELFKEMINNRIMPDEVTMVSVISACGHIGALELGNWVLYFINANRVKLSLSGYNSLIFMYSRCGSMNEANMIFHKMEARDAVSHNALIAGFAAHGNGIEALNVMEKMIYEGIEPDRITYIGVLTACSHSGMLDEAQKVFESIEAPSVDHYACMIDLLGRAGKLDEAKRLVEEMPMHPHEGIYGSLLNASRIHRRVDIGVLAANKLFELEPENSGNYALLSNIYASIGKWKEVDKIRELMKTSGLMKTTGWSWVEHAGKMHKFIAGDRSHEKSNEIHNKLAELRTKIQGVGYVADKSNVLRDVEDEEKEEMVGTHSEKLGVAFALLVSEPGSVIRVVKNIRICLDCHNAIKMISWLEEREIIVRDNNRFHCFKDNSCSCHDYW